MNKSLISTSIVASAFILLSYTAPVWSRNPGGVWIPIIAILLVVLFFWLIVKAIREVIRFIKSPKRLAPKESLPIIVIVVVLWLTLSPPFNFDVEELVYGKPEFRACYEGTQNQTTFKLRDNNKFEIHATGVFFSNEYFTGEYTQQNDTLYLKYDAAIAESVGEKVFMNNKEELLQPVGVPADSIRRPIYFYYGDCKGLN